MMEAAPVSAPRKARSGSQKRQRAKLAGMACTPAERAELEARAERAGMTVSAYMRHQCLGEAGPRAVRRPPVERAALAALLGQLGRSAGELGKCGSNVNQIARALNTDRDIPHDIDGTLADLRAATDEIRAAALAISATLRGKPE